mmetsp:Transcript_8452/g.14249  ORF Transcript_8452/g.14249 Transcript_8452/m.14249 type:complete len:304 (+) Transcript_8452:54-965(+)
MYGGGYDDGGMGGGFMDGGQFGNDYAGNADAFGGNQFQASQPTGNGGFNIDNSSPDGKAKSRDSQSLIPVTIKQLKGAMAATGGEQGFTIDGKDLHQVTIVGVIMSAEEQNTNLQYQLDDGTDDIMVKMWIDADADESIMERRAFWKEGKLVRVVGQLRSFNHTRSIVAFNISPITDFNEYTFHFIEAVHTHLRNTRGKPPAAGGNAMPAAGGSIAVGGYGMQQPSMRQPGGGMQQRPPSLQDTVLSFFTNYGHSESGCTVKDCYDAMKAQGSSMSQIRECVDMLVGEGHLYSTIDDEHFKST